MRHWVLGRPDNWWIRYVLVIALCGTVKGVEIGRDMLHLKSQLGQLQLTAGVMYSLFCMLQASIGKAHVPPLILSYF